jgi:hypothetical protein
MQFQKGWGNGLTNRNPPLALPTPSHIPLAWHSGTEVVTSGLPEVEFSNSSVKKFSEKKGSEKEFHICIADEFSVCITILVGL